LVEKVRDIVGLYLDPPAHAAVFCVDEKPQIQALDRTQPLLPMQPGQVERRTHDYNATAPRRCSRRSMRRRVRSSRNSINGTARRISRVLDDRRARPARVRCVSSRQLRHAQNPVDPPLVRQASAFSVTHADVRLRPVTCGALVAPSMKNIRGSFLRAAAESRD
jgi:hypothetical protein